MKSSIAAAVALIAAAGPTLAAPVTYSCQFLDGYGQVDLYGQVDQIVIDEDQALIDLRVASTMGTTLPINWVLTNRTLGDGTVESITLQRAPTGALLAAGFTSSGAYSFRIDDGLVALGVTYGTAQAFTWQCAP